VIGGGAATERAVLVTLTFARPLFVNLDVPVAVDVLLPHRQRRVRDRDRLSEPRRLRDVVTEHRRPEQDAHSDE